MNEEIREAFELFLKETHSYKEIAKEYGQGDTALQAMAFLKGWMAHKEKTDVQD